MDRIYESYGHSLRNYEVVIQSIVQQALENASLVSKAQDTLVKESL